jgi:hypothetical protein
VGLLPVVVGALAYLLTCHAFRLAEVRAVASALRWRPSARNGRADGPTH